MLNNYFLLYITFLKIGSLAFGGGYAVLPLIHRYVVIERNWLTMNQLSDLVSLSQITPGPIGINSATFIGVKTAGLFGGIIATIAEVTPCCILMLVLGHFLFKGKKIKFMDYILKGLKPAITGLILIAAINMFSSAVYSSKNELNIIGIIGFIIGMICTFYKKIDIVKIIGISSITGILLSFIL